MSGNKYRPIDPLSQAARLSRTQANPIRIQHHTMPVQEQQAYYPQAPQQQYQQPAPQYQPQYQQPQQYQPQYQQPSAPQYPQQYYQPTAPQYQPQYQQPAAPQYQLPEYQQPQYQQPLPEAPNYSQQPAAPYYQEPQQPQQQIPEPPKTRRLITGESLPSPMTQQIPLPSTTQRVNLGLSSAPQGNIPAPTPTRALNLGVPSTQGQVIPAPTPTQTLKIGQGQTSMGGGVAPQLSPTSLNGVGASQMTNPLRPGGQSIPAPPPTRLLVGNTNNLKPAEAAAPAPAQQQASLPQDEASLDSAVTSLGPVPYYSLTQVVENLRSSSNLPTATSAVGVSATSGDAASGARYLDEQEIGEGGTCIVYRATDKRMRRNVALKRFKSMSRTDKERDYTLEMKAASQVNHPYVVSIYDADVDEKGRYLAMELIDGFNMEDAVKLRELKFDINRFINFAEQALEGLEATHKAGLLHLDLKPSNVMLSEQGSGRDIVKLIDFGRAQLIQDEDGYPPKGRGLEGSIFFCSPEQILKEDLDVRSDLYSLGTIFYWVLTRQRPFDGGNPIAIMSSHLQHKVKDISEIIPNIPKWLAEWVMALMSLEKEDRPQTAADALDTLLNGRDEQKVTRFRA